MCDSVFDVDGCHVARFGVFVHRENESHLLECIVFFLNIKITGTHECCIFSDDHGECEVN